MRVLGIESSCDETGIAIYDDEQGLIADTLYSQIELHQAYGGVVPELASRDHIRKISPLVKQALADANCAADDIDGVAYTSGPGLMGALLVGACFGRSLAFAWNKPAIGVHHMEGHLLAPMLEEQAPAFPFTALLVSGGHTLLVAVEAIGQYKILGESIDDAAGEAFDKTAKMLGLPYPGGPELAKLAEQGEAEKYTFPRPLTRREHGVMSLDFSFSGLKTQVLNTSRKAKDAGELTQQGKADICHAFQEAVVDTLTIKCKEALKVTGHKTLVIAGGVGANIRLREQLQAELKKINASVFYPRLKYCTDNGAMIAYAGLQRLKAGQTEDLSISATPRWSIEELPAL